MFGKISTVLWSLAAGVATAATVTSVPDVPVNGTTAGILASVVGGIVWGALKLRPFMSRQAVDLKADSMTKEMLDRLTKERDNAMTDARQAWSSKNADSMELGQLRAEVAFLKAQHVRDLELINAIRRGVQDVGQKVDTVKSRMESTEKRISNSGVAPLGEP